MSSMDRVDYDLMKYEQKSAEATAKFEEFCKQADEIVSDMAHELNTLKSDYEEFIDYDELAQYVKEAIALEFDL